MANTPKDLPRVVQSDLHDAIDKLGEQVARGELVEIETKRDPFSPYKVNADRCVCKRYSERNGDVVTYWEERNPLCKYVHLAPPQEKPYSVPV